MQDTADPTKVILIRQDGSYQVEDVKKVLAGNFQEDLQLRPMDTVYVPTSSIGDIDTFVQLYIKNILPITLGIGPRSARSGQPGPVGVGGSRRARRDTRLVAFNGRGSGCRARCRP